MSFDIFLTLVGLAFASAWTPGPNNAMLASSGATFGIRPTVPHALGVCLGFPLMIFCIALGLGQLFLQSALLREGLRIAGMLALIWFAWKIANAAPPGSGQAGSRPLTFVQAAGFQWVNPKAWIMAVGITAQFVTGEKQLSESLIIALVFMVVGGGSAFGWTFFGVALQRWLRTDNRLRIFNLTMAGLILISIGVIAFAELG